VIALRRLEDYPRSKARGLRSTSENLRNRVDADASASFEARLEACPASNGELVRWSAHALRPPLLTEAAGLFREGMSVREVAAMLRISKTEAGRMRLRLVSNGMPLSYQDETAN
jgi:hypothetical protein